MRWKSGWWSFWRSTITHLADPGRMDKVLEEVSADVESLLEGFGGLTAAGA
jgi:hypothetical protein